MFNNNKILRIVGVVFFAAVASGIIVLNKTDSALAQQAVIQDENAFCSDANSSISRIIIEDVCIFGNCSNESEQADILNVESLNSVVETAEGITSNPIDENDVSNVVGDLATEVGANVVSDSESGIKTDAIISDSTTLNSDTKNIPKKTIAAPVKKAASTSGGIGLPGPILSETDIMDGKKVCANKNDKPKMSKKNPKWHIDGECCLDPDEIPNSLCYYPQKKYAGMIQRYLNRK